MLFLLNNQIIEVESPELHLARYWKRIGCGEPMSLRASDAVDFSVMVVNAHFDEGIKMDETVLQDLAALLISKTGANAALFNGSKSAKLNVLPEAVLAGLAEERAVNVQSATDAVWSGAA
ncbi:MAG: hypothetical protein ABJG15_18195 [Hyphomonadaceae bacterium]